MQDSTQKIIDTNKKNPRNDVYLDFNEVIHKLINTIVSKCAMPKNMNISIMIPLVKDSKKAHLI